jgi:hypothetical protein
MDSSNHRSHVLFPKRNNTGKNECPSTHSVQIPRFTLQMNWSINSGDVMSQWHLSSDRMANTTFPNGSTLHADWLGAWDQNIMETWAQKCIREIRNCSASKYGDGTIGVQPTNWNWTNPNRLVDIPSRP